MIINSIERQLHLFQSVINNTTYFVGLLDLQGRLILANKTSLDFIGAKEEDLLNLYFWDCPWWTHSPVEQERLKNSITEALQGKIIEFETSHTDAENKLHYVNFTIRPVNDASGNLQYLLPEGNDITHQKELEQALSESVEYNRIMASSTLEGIAITKNQQMLEVNQQMLDMFGYTFDELKIKGLPYMVHPDDLENVKQHINSESNEPYEHRGITKEGNIFYVEARGSHLFYKGQWCRLTVIRNISERKKNELELADNELKYHSLFDNTSDAIFLMKDNKFTDCNISTLNIFGCTREEIINTSPIEFSPEFQPDGRKSMDKAKEKIELAYNGIHQFFEWVHCKLNKETFYAEVSLNRLMLKNEWFLLAIVRDITSRKLYEKELEMHRNHLEVLVAERTSEIEALNEELNQTNEELSLTNDSLLEQRNNLNKTLEQLREAQNQLVQSEKMATIGTLTAGLAHEINNPINFISATAQAIEEIINDILLIFKEYRELDQNNFNEKIQTINELKNSIEFDKSLDHLPSTLKTLKTGVTRTTDIVNSLRQFSRSDGADKLPLDIHEGIRSTLMILKHRYKYNIEIKTDFEQLPPILGFQNKLNQVLMNLISNAIDSILEKPILKDIEYITIKTHAEKKSIFITITDTGHGVPDHLTNKIFEPFFTTKLPGKGTGMGLSICMNIINEHQGKILMRNMKPEGAEFTIELPIIKPV